MPTELDLHFIKPLSNFLFVKTINKGFVMTPELPKINL